MDLNPSLLLAAIVAAAAAAVLAVAVRVGMYRARLVQWVPIASGLSLLALAVAGVHHLFTGHGHDSPEPLDPITFLREHPVLIAVAAFALLAMGLARTRDRR